MGQALALGLLVTLAVASVIFLVEVMIPGTTLHNFFSLALHASSATLRANSLFQQYAESIQTQEALFSTPLSLLCGGLTLGALAPRYETCRRLLLSGAGLALGVLVVSLAFVWPAAIIQQNMMITVEGGAVYPVTAPWDLIVRQIVWALIWIGVCVLGTWLGARWRDQHGNLDPI